MWMMQVRGWEGSGVESGGVRVKEEAGGDGEEDVAGRKNGERLCGSVGRG